MSWRLSPGHRLNVVTIQCESLLRLLDRFKTPVADYSVAAGTMRKCGLAIDTLSTEDDAICVDLLEVPLPVIFSLSSLSLFSLSPLPLSWSPRL